MSAPKHLVMVTRALPHHSIGGMEAVAWDLATEFVRRGVAVTVLTAAISGKPEAFIDDGVHIRALRGTAWQHYGRQWWRATRRVFEEELLSTCDIVLSVSGGGYGLLPLRSSAPNLPFVFQAHGTSIGEAVSKWKSGSPRGLITSGRNVVWIARDLAAYRKFDAIVAVGTRVAEDFSIWPIANFVDTSRLRLIPNGIDTRLFCPNADARTRMRRELGLTEDMTVVASVCRLHKQKGVDLGLDAISLRAKETGKICYLVVGDGPESDSLISKARRMSLSDVVRFTGAVGREKVADYLNAADAMLFLTRRVEGNPLNILEALSVGLPVIASEHLKQTIPPSKDIKLVDPYSALNVASALRSTVNLNSPRMSLLPRRFSLSESANAYLNLFGELMLRRHRV